MPRARSKPSPVDRDEAEAIALQGLTFLAGDPARMARFVKLTGIEPAEMRARADAPELLLAVLEHLSADESLLLVFAASHGIAPESIARAIALMEGESA